MPYFRSWGHSDRKNAKVKKTVKSLSFLGHNSARAAELRRKEKFAG
jgi:hypothetical protein